MLYISSFGKKAHMPHGKVRIPVIVSEKAQLKQSFRKGKKTKQEKECFWHNGLRKDLGAKTTSSILN